MNKQIWNLYKASEEGKKIISLFDFDNDISMYERMEKLYDIGKKWGANSDFKEVYNNWIFGIEDLKRQKFLKDRIYFEEFIDNFVFVEGYYDAENRKFTFNPDKIYLKKDDYRGKVFSISVLSWILSFCYTSLIPILNPMRFDIFQRNCNLLGIELPDIPKTKDYREFCFYYFDICSALTDFAKEYNLSQAELCACIYDFASMLSDEKKSEELPEPTNVWFTGAKGNNQFIYLDNLLKKKNADANQCWACNERTKRGDIIVMYCTSPRSYIHSIWRANSNGIFNPFTYYQKMTTVCNGIEVPKVTFKDLKDDSYWGQVPIVRGNLQGLNGVEITAEQYEKLLEIFKRKGMSLRKIPKLFSSKSVNFGTIKVEKDVEEKILIPLLEKIGYAEGDWTRQLSLKAGRKEKAIPDFVFYPKGESHFESSPFVIEAKYDFSSMIEFQKAFSQCFSYAKMLQAKIMGICDKERLVVYKINSTGSFDRDNPVFENHWKAIYSDSVIGAKLKQLIGAEVVKGM